ncbi:hypothetical protein KFE25_005947 [Diacronema lutheri]|uniref:Uncharacterized protein n=1 Tax=Diacronema lutheri TaxID=2081491 RepID=A0A8J6CC41_DIALT|nr:hypothetical protein KFE25_005947 [Diacronema lutheri]
MGVRGAPAAPTPTRRLDKKLEPRVRRPRAASMAVRNKYWRADLYPRARPQGKGNARTKRAARPAPRSATQPAPRAPTRASRPRSEESPAPRSAIRTLLKLDAAARKRGATDVLKHEPFAPANAKAAAPMARNEAAQQPLVDPVVVVNLLKLAHGCAMSASSQLPGAWRFDKRPRRGDPLLRTLICPCGARLRSAVDSCPQGYYCGFPTGKATPPNPCTKPYNPWLAPPRIAHADAGTSDDEEPLPAYGCHLHHTFRLSNIAHYGVKDTWTDFGQWHDRESDGE